MSKTINSFDQAVQSLQAQRTLRVDATGGNLHALSGLEKAGVAFQRVVLRRSPEQLGTSDAAVAKALAGLYRNEHAGSSRFEVARQLGRLGLDRFADLLAAAPRLEQRSAVLEPGVPPVVEEPIFQTLAEVRGQTGLPDSISPQRLAAAARHGRDLAVAREPKLAAPAAIAAPKRDPAITQLVADLRSGSVDATAFVVRVFPLIKDRLGSHAAGVIDVRSDNYYARLGDKARYRDIGVPRHSAVVLASGETVHANRVTLGGLGEPSIAAQAPTSNTLQDFLGVVREQDVRTIVDLTNNDDKRQRSVPDYARDPAHGLDGVDSTTADLRAIGVEQRALSLPDQPVAYLNFTRWPDHGAPALRDFSQLVDSVVRERQGKPGALLVHCTAGVGRTGTLYAGLELNRLARNGELNPGNVLEKVLDVVADGRRDRGLAFVQAPVQLALLFDYAESLLGQG